MTMQSTQPIPVSQECTEDRILHLEEELQKLRIQVDSQKRKNMASIVCFSGEWDRLFAAFTIANGVLASGYEVHMFFTFWGATAMRSPGTYKPEGKNWMQKMLTQMLPDGIDKAPLSKMNYGGMGKVMMGKLMKEKGVDNIQVLMEQARELGVQFHLCDTSLSLFGWENEELLDGEDSDWCGVATFLSWAEKSKIVLFV
jgi:peroxiredoxin family protein